MDLYQELAREVGSRKERDRALEFLRQGYSSAIRGTEWEALRDELEAEREAFDPDDALEFYEVEGRGVGVVWPDEGMGQAWVWRDGWRSAPGLVNKSWLEGQRLSRAKFNEEFADADLLALEAIGRSAFPSESGCEGAHRPTASEAHDQLRRAILRAVQTWADDQALAITQRVRGELQRMPASGIFAREDHRNVWDEYCLQVQSGPPALDSAWSATIDPMLVFEVEQLSRANAVLITLLCRWNEHDLADPVDHQSYNPDTIRRFILRCLQELAQDPQQDWITD